MDKKNKNNFLLSLTLEILKNANIEKTPYKIYISDLAKKIKFLNNERIDYSEFAQNLIKIIIRTYNFQRYIDKNIVSKENLQTLLTYFSINSEEYHAQAKQAYLDFLTFEKFPIDVVNDISILLNKDNNNVVAYTVNDDLYKIIVKIAINSHIMYAGAKIKGTPNTVFFINSSDKSAFSSYLKFAKTTYNSYTFISTSEQFDYYVNNFTKNIIPTEKQDDIGVYKVNLDKEQEFTLNNYLKYNGLLVNYVDLIDDLYEHLLCGTHYQIFEAQYFTEIIKNVPELKSYIESNALFYNKLYSRVVNKIKSNDTPDWCEIKGLAGDCIIIEDNEISFCINKKTSSIMLKEKTSSEILDILMLNISYLGEKLSITFNDCVLSTEELPINYDYISELILFLCSDSRQKGVKNEIEFIKNINILLTNKDLLFDGFKQYLSTKWQVDLQNESLNLFLLNAEKCFPEMLAAHKQSYEYILNQNWTKEQYQTRFNKIASKEIVNEDMYKNKLLMNVSIQELQLAKQSLEKISER